MANQLYPQSAISPLHRTTFALLNLAVGLTYHLSITPPQPINTTTASTTTIDTIRPTTHLIPFVQLAVSLLILSQTLFILLPSLFPTPRLPLNPTILTPNPTSLLTLSLILGATLLRLHAMRTLHSSFTFALSRPPSLQTAGVYAYLQHPGYAGLAVSTLGIAAWFARPDGVLGVVPMPRAALGRLAAWHGGMVAALAALTVAVGWVRVLEEERLLKAAFGAEWERWSARTARLVPGVF